MHRGWAGDQRDLRDQLLTEAEPDQPVTPVPAASVILVRHSAEGIELFMVRRHIKSDFAPDVYVFPGGKADPADAMSGDHLVMPAVPRLTGRDEPGVGWRAIFMAAIRELFEESGLLLARNSAATTPNTWLPDPDVLSRYRDQIRCGALTMRALARQESLTYSGDDLRLYCNWITPEILSRRFDTFFFLAQFPEGAEARLADSFELTDCLWVRPQAALERNAAGDFPLVFATERILEALSRYDSPAALWEAATVADIEPICPRWFEKEGEQVFVIPGDTDYDSARTR